MKQLYVFLVLVTFAAELCTSVQSQAIQSIRVNPDPLIPGENFTITVEASGVRQAAAMVDFRRIDKQQIRIPLSFDETNQRELRYSGSGTVPADIDILQENFIDITVIVAGDGRNRVQQTVQVGLLKNAQQRGEPDIKIDQPVNNSVVTVNSVGVTGTFEGAVSVEVNGVNATLSGNNFSANSIPVVEGVNVIVATAKNINEQTVSQTVHVRRDTTPPLIVIESPLNGDRLITPTTAVAGTVNEIIPGAQVNADDVSVSINGVPATVNNRTYFLENLPLQIGQNQITVTATDVAGNTSSQSISVTREPDLAGVRLQVAGGNAQSQSILSTLPQLLEVKATLPDGTELPQRPIQFTVSNGDGLLGDPNDKARVVQVLTDAQGVAQVQFTLGSRTGEGFHRVKATSPGSLAFAEFCATASPNPPSNIAISQMAPARGQVNKVLPVAIATIITDSGGNPVAGVNVRFDVTQGGGSFDNSKPFVDALTNPDGIAEALWRIGPEPGLGNNEVQATFNGNPGLPAIFKCSGIATGPVSDTKISGIVQNSAGDPIVGAKAVVRGTQLEAFTGGDGRFELTNVIPGGHHVAVLGSAANQPGIFFPDIEFEVEALAGIDNRLDPPIVVLPFIDDDSGKIVGGATEEFLFMEGVPGFSIKIAPHSTFKRDAQGNLVQMPLRMSSSQVKFDKVPMPPPQGSTPLVVGTLQPGGILFNPPAEVCYPNVEGYDPGDVADVFAFHHDIGQFVNVGPGTVSEDGTVVCSDPGFGIVQSGWHCLIRLPGPAGNCQRVNDCTANWTWQITANGAGNGANKPVALRADTADASKNQKAKVTATFNPLGALEGNWTVADASVARIVGGASGNMVTIEAVGPGTTKLTSPTNRIPVAGDDPDKTCQLEIDVIVCGADVLFTRAAPEDATGNKYGYDEMTADPQDDHVSVKRDDFTFVKVTVNGLPAGERIFYVSKKPASVDVQDPGANPGSPFKLKILGKSSDKDEVVVEARYGATDGPVCGKITVNVYKEIPLNGKYVRVYQTGKEAQTIAALINKTDIENRANKWLKYPVVKVSIGAASKKAVDFDKNENLRVDFYKNGANPEIKAIRDALSADGFGYRDLVVLKQSFYRNWYISSSVAAGDTTITVPGISGLLLNNTYALRKADGTAGETFQITGIVGNTVSIDTNPATPAIDGFANAHPKTADPKTTHTIVDTQFTTAGLSSNVASDTSALIVGANANALGDVSAHEHMHGQGLSDVNNAANVMHKDTSNNPSTLPFTYNKQIPVITGTTTPKPGAAQESQWEIPAR